VVYQHAVEYGEAGSLSQYSIKPWNFEIQLTFYLLGLSNFNIHSLVHKHQGRLLSIITQRQGRTSENLDSRIPYSLMFLLLVGTITSTFVSAFKQILENVQTHPLKSTIKHFVYPRGNNTFKLRTPGTMEPYIAKNWGWWAKVPDKLVWLLVFQNWCRHSKSTSTICHYSGMPPQQSGCQTTATSSSTWLISTLLNCLWFLAPCRRVSHFFPTQTS